MSYVWEALRPRGYGRTPKGFGRKALGFRVEGIYNMSQRYIEPSVKGSRTLERHKGLKFNV